MSFDLNRLSKLVEDEYSEAKPQRALFCVWGYPNHVLVVDNIARDLAEKYGGNIARARAAALLHDIADARMSRHHPEHQKYNRAQAIYFLREAGMWHTAAEELYDADIAPHSCRDGNIPETLEGKILAAADALAHLTGGFYLHFLQYWHLYRTGENFETFRVWANAKIHRDAGPKIYPFFEDEKKLAVEWAKNLLMCINSMPISY